MQNPVLENRKTWLAYLSSWILVACIYVLQLALTTNVPLYKITGESLIVNGLFAAMGIVLWYPLFYGKPENEKTANFIIRHIFACLTAVGIWIGILYLLLYGVFGSDPDYRTYLNESLVLKAATGILYYWLIILAYYLLLFYRNMKKGLVKEAELKTLVKESELSSLKSQINPHFLFNSLNSISSLTMIHPEKAQEMIIKLSEFLRYSISNKDENLTTLLAELENMNRYVDIEKIRFGERLNIVQQIDKEALELKLPGLILQPVMENAVKYSIYQITGKTDIELVCKSQPGLLFITVKNPYDPDAGLNKGAGFGLQNIRNRLRIIYNRDDLMDIQKDLHFFEIRIAIPQPA